LLGKVGKAVFRLLALKLTAGAVVVVRPVLQPQPLAVALVSEGKIFKLDLALMLRVAGAQVLLLMADLVALGLFLQRQVLGLRVQAVRL
jgi:hypothetical protein